MVSWGQSLFVRGERSSVVELHLAKVVVVGSNPIARSIFYSCVYWGFCLIFRVFCERRVLLSVYQESRIWAVWGV